MKQGNILYFAVNEPYGLYHKKDVATSPVGAHTHNSVEVYLTLTDLPDVLLNDTVSKVRRGSLIIIPPFCVHQMYHEKGIGYERYIMNINSEWLGYVICSSGVSVDYLENKEAPLIIPIEKKQLKDLTDSMEQFVSLQSENGRSIAEIARFFELFNMIDSIVKSIKEYDIIEKPVILVSLRRLSPQILHPFYF